MDSVITTIYQCMQRGERPLSLVDLVEKDLLTLNQAAWLVSRIEQGSSWLTGAIPGHAGKTTLMSALLVFLPAQEQPILARAGMSWESFGQNSCTVVEEISNHGREQYLWGEDVVGFTSIPARGGRIASTLHATTLEQVREQVAEQSGTGESGVASFGMFIPIEVTYAQDSSQDALEGNFLPQGRKRHRQINSRTVELIHYYDEDDSRWHQIDREVKLVGRHQAISDFLRLCLESEIRSCESLRQAWLARG